MTADKTAGAKLLVLYGPTGVGKTGLAIELSRLLGGEIVGADSVQVYRGFDIGSAKPTAAELGDVPHHLLDILDPTEAIDAARYATLADAAIASISARGRVPIVVGGTGLWLRALLRGLVALPPVDARVRAQLEEEWRRDPDRLYARLREIDPLAAARVHRNDMVRVVRALEVFEQTGAPLGALRKAHQLGAPRYRAHVLALDVPEPHYTHALRARVGAMLERGLIDEVQRLRARYGDTPRALQSVGYKQVLGHLQGSLEHAELEARILQASRAYARRQRTWARTDADITQHLAPSDVLSEPVLTQIRSHLRVPSPHD